MTQQQIYAGLTQVMCDVFDTDDITLTPATTARDVAGWDSQAHILLIVAAEQHFGVRFGTADFESMRNVGEFAALIDAKLKN
ncbi:acyl carrier protein [Sphingomonas aracearum]|uniref:Acyl carrier protein n=2 Tax=Sphingomonas aracearum TaxID=2283317 RepID=A0A369VXH0_9SPHN|nr:acyl carrier protein [Sphingomonas aracearum]